MAQNKIIVKVYINKFNNQKLLTVPKNCGIENGDFVEIKKVTLNGDSNRL